MRLTVGMASYDNYAETWFTVQALRMFHDLSDCEILIVDNFGSDVLHEYVKKQGAGVVRYERRTERQGTAWAKNRVFEHAKGAIVLCIDSHVLLKRGAIESIHETEDLIHGPLIYTDCKTYSTAMLPVWRGHMWGIWADVVKKLPDNPVDIWGMGMGCFYTCKNSWLGYNEKFKGFGGEEGYIHEKYRQAGRRVISDPRLAWQHFFRPNNTNPPFKLSIYDKARNYLIGFKELGLDPQEMAEHFGKDVMRKARSYIGTV